MTYELNRTEHDNRTGSAAQLLLGENTPPVMRKNTISPSAASARSDGFCEVILPGDFSAAKE
jgi:hypothetical protein